MARGTMAATAALMLAACSSTSDVTLELTDMDDNCAPAFALVHTLSIEATADGGRCRLKSECVFAVTVASIADMEAALRDRGAVLLEVDAGAAQILRVNGRPLNDCFPRQNTAGEEINLPVICGDANFDEASDGVISVELSPDGCTESLGLCP